MAKSERATMSERRIVTACLIVIAAATVWPGPIKAQENQSRPALLRAARHDGSVAGFENAPVGKPVVVSRFDTEASVSRVREMKILENSAESGASTPTADPAFKAVFLTPRGSTGRPVPIQMAGLTRPEEDVKKVDEEPTKEIKQPEPASTSGALNSQEKAVPKPAVVSTPPSRLGPAVSKSATNRQNLRSPQPKTAPHPKVAGSERPNYGAAEIGAVRAFTRF